MSKDKKKSWLELVILQVTKCMKLRFVAYYITELQFPILFSAYNWRRFSTSRPIFGFQDTACYMLGGSINVALISAGTIII